MEKRLIPLDARPIRFYCSYCERLFSPADEMVDRQSSGHYRPCFRTHLTNSRHHMLRGLHVLWLEMQHLVCIPQFQFLNITLTEADTNPS